MTTLRLYHTYSFKTKDPAIDELRTIVDDQNATYGQLEKISGVSSTTLRNWFYGPTRRPQSATLEAVGRALGKKRVWVNDSENSTTFKDFLKSSGTARKRKSKK